GEQPLLPYESCNLGSINLAKMLRLKRGHWEMDWKKLEETVDVAVRFLDNVIDMSRFPIAQIDRMTKANRKIGLGVMGFADMLILLDIPYDSQQALETSEDIMRFINERARKASAALAEERGSFPAFRGSIYDGGELLRNATRTTIAPTGTLSIIAGCSSGIEPLFALSYVRNILDNDQLIEVHPLFQEVAQARGFHSEGLMKELSEKGCAREIEGIPEDVKRLFVTAHDISPEWHVRMQAAFQRHTDNAVSKTINFPHDATVEDVEKAYMLAYREGCKGITIYRDRSRDRQVLSVPQGQGEKKEKATAPAPTRIQPRQRPIVTRGQTHKVVTGCGNLYVTVNSDEEGRLCEVFSHLGKAGGCAAAQGEATSRLISLALRSGIDPDSIVGQLRAIRCPSIAWDQGQAVLSCPDALGSVLGRYLEGNGGQGNKVSELHRELAEPTVALSSPQDASSDISGRFINLAGQCPECSSLLVYQEGCYVCRSCGYTKC
ncbi:MAG: TSCPD domain-containing protein, partial [Chloroflexi bacterium]|nr:TSCPD domain-containing protein [Chloroflexota bacterium]